MGMVKKKIYFNLLLFFCFSFLACSNVEQTLEKSLDELIAERNSPFITTTTEEEIMKSGQLQAELPNPGFILGEDNLRLSFRDYQRENQSADIILFIHGSTSHSAHYNLLMQGIAMGGCFARAIDVRGFGLSACESATQCSYSENGFTRTYLDDGIYFAGKIGAAKDQWQYARDIKLHTDSLIEQYPASRIHMACHSSGCGIAARYIERYTTLGLSSIILLAPMHHSKQEQNQFSTLSQYAILNPHGVQRALNFSKHHYVLGFNLGHSLPGLQLSVTQITWDAMLAINATHKDNFWQTYDLPVLYALGDSDQLFDRSLAIAEFQKALKPGEFYIVPQTSHIGMAWNASLGEKLAQWSKVDYANYL